MDRRYQLGLRRAFAHARAPTGLELFRAGRDSVIARSDEFAFGLVAKPLFDFFWRISCQEWAQLMCFRLKRRLPRGLPRGQQGMQRQKKKVACLQRS